MKKIICIILTFISLFIYNPVVDSQEVQKDFALITTGTISLSGTSKIIGNVGMGSDILYLTERDSHNIIDGTVVCPVYPTIIAWAPNEQIKGGIKIDQTDYKYPTINLNQSPMRIGTNRGNYTFDWYPVPPIINSSCNFTDLTVKSTMKIDNTNNDIYIYADSITLTGGSSIILLGSKNVFLFTKKLTGTGNINTSGLSNNLHIFIYESPIIYTGGYTANANFYICGNFVATSGCKINGNIIVNGTSCTITDNAKINGLVYATESDVMVSRSGKITGRLIAGGDVILNGVGIIEYKECSLYIPDILIQTPTPTNTVTLTPTVLPTLTPTTIVTLTPFKQQMVYIQVQSTLIVGDVTKIIVKEVGSNNEIPIDKFIVKLSNNKVIYKNNLLIASKIGEVYIELSPKTDKYILQIPTQLIHIYSDIT